MTVDNQYTSSLSTSIDSDRRRSILQQSVVASAMALGMALPAWAGIPEVDSKTGELYSPKADMLSGGSQAARGGALSDTNRQRGSKKLKPGESLQTIYETRFIAYLTRFLLTFDPAAHAWWVQQGMGDTWEATQGTTSALAVESTFAEFAESVEYGLADYFSGPYGSYSSLSAMKAGLLAAQPAPSQKTSLNFRNDPLGSLVPGGSKKRKSSTEDRSQTEAFDRAKQGILNLYTLLKARYTSTAAKRQLAILFSFISSPRLQPVPEISALLGEADNASVAAIQLLKSEGVGNEIESRSSSRRGGGYSIGDFPTVTIDPPPALGDAYKCAKAVPIMKPTSRVLSIKVTDGGEGYSKAPRVRVLQGGIVLRGCQASAILDREGHVECILVLDPGYGYGGRNAAPPTIDIETPIKQPQEKGKKEKVIIRRAKAVAILEYEITGIEVTRGGNGYVKTEPPGVHISPPEEDPDWFLAVQEQPELRMVPFQVQSLKAQVSEMVFPDGNVAFSIAGNPSPRVTVDESLIERIQREPLELLPSSIRPQLRSSVQFPQSTYYSIPYIETIPQVVAVLSPRYRAYDPLFGGVGKVPVTKGALELRASEYARLALSGAVCTVLVRTLLNPLELVKTKQQLLNDKELLDYARQKKQKSSEERAQQPVDYKLNPERSADVDSVTSQKVGTFDVLRSMVELRGPFSLFQSADITFLASLVFGSIGFGATELFRRSFTSVFFTGENDQSGSEVVLLVAAALATVVTAAAASPFEVLRVRSMGLLEPTKWTNVMRDFLVRSFCLLVTEATTLSPLTPSSIFQTILTGRQ